MSKESLWLRSIVFLVFMVLLAVFLPAQGRGGGGGGGGKKNDATPLDAAFSDRVGDRVFSDGQGVYSDGVDGLGVHVHPNSANLMLHTKDSDNRVVRYDVSGYGELLPDHAQFLLAAPTAGDNGEFTGLCSDQRVGDMVGGESKICRMRVRLARNENNLQYALEYLTAVHCATALGLPCDTWVVNGDVATLIRHGGKGKNAVGTPGILRFWSRPSACRSS